MTVEEQNKELKRLLKEAIKILSVLGCCGYDCNDCEYEKYNEQGGTCYGLDYKWKYLDKAEELVGEKQ